MQRAAIAMRMLGVLSWDGTAVTLHNAAHIYTAVKRAA